MAELTAEHYLLTAWEAANPGAMDAVLCYVANGRAWFTTQALDKQSGDDWNDSPYQTNAGPPYTEKGQRLWTVAWEAELEEARAAYPNHYFSVDTINQRVVPWLRRNRYDAKPPLDVWAGATLRQFIADILGDGGTVYLPVRRTDGE